MATEHDKAAWKAYFCEWSPLRYPGGLFAALTVVATLVLARVGTAFSVVVLLASLPVQVYAARRVVFTVALATATTGLHLAYWLVTRGRADVLTDERVIVAFSAALTAFALGASAYNPHQYGRRDGPEQFRIDAIAATCAVPIFATAPYSDGALPLGAPDA